MLLQMSSANLVYTIRVSNGLDPDQDQLLLGLSFTTSVVPLDFNILLYVFMVHNMGLPATLLGLSVNSKHSFKY